MTSNTMQVQVSINSDDGELLITGDERQLDDVLKALSNERRRQILYALKRESLPMEVRTLAREVAVLEANEDMKAVSEDSITQIHTMLYHHHLPMMAELGLIDYNAEETDGVSSVEEISDQANLIHV